MLASYHTHTRWSDGKATTTELVNAAAKLGMGEIGISDHWVLHPKGELKSWAMKPDALPAYVKEILELKAAHASAYMPVVRLGLEVDWFPFRRDAIARALEPYPFDYLIGSVHEVDGFTIDMSPESWKGLKQSQIDAMHTQYWIHVRSMAESGLFTIAAHLDLPKKFGFRPTEEPANEIEAALDAIADAKMVVEINTSGWHKPCEDAYPTFDILVGVQKRGIRVTLSADAHQPEHLARDFDRAAARLARAGFDEVARFDGKQVRMEALGDCWQIPVPA